jgi:hypothetical protein
LIYLDTSVLLAKLLTEERAPPRRFWEEGLVSSRLLVYEAWSRINRRALGATHGPLLAQLLDRVAFLELREDVLARAKDPFPVQVRTLDGLHLASLAFLAERGVRAPLASYDERLVAAARAMRLPIARL